MEETIIVLIDGVHGVHIPQLFAERFADDFTYPDAHQAYLDDIAILKQGVEHEHYHEVWDAIEMRAVVRSDGGPNGGPKSRYAGWSPMYDDSLFLVSPDHRPDDEDDA